MRPEGTYDGPVSVRSRTALVGEVESPEDGVEETDVTRLYGIAFERPAVPPRPDEIVAAFPSTPGLYLHVPFCRTICPFCPYNKVRHRPDLAAAYFEALGRELSAYLAVESGPFPSLYVGGGTPTLCLAELQPVLERITVTGERAVEVLPTHMTATRAEQLEDLGFDFVSLGIQSFDAGVLRRLRRPTTVADNLAALDVAAGRFACVDVDLIFDAAYDAPGVLLSDLRICFEAGIDQISTYPLMRFGFTPLGKARHDRRAEHRLLREATELAAGFGYERRSVWTFNRRGSPAYTSITRPYYLGLGAGAASYAGELFVLNHFGLDPYLADLAAGRLPIARIARLPRPAAAAYRAFWQAYTGRMPSDGGDRLLSDPAVSILTAGARAAGWMRRSNGGLVLTRRGYDRYHDLERWVTYHLIEPLWEELMAEHEAA
jgi:menaquinone C8-methyltransferase